MNPAPAVRAAQRARPRSLRSDRTRCRAMRRSAPTCASRSRGRARRPRRSRSPRSACRAPECPGPLIRKLPNTWPTPFVVSTRLQARIVSAPASRGSELVAVPVYVAFVAWNVSPPVTEHVTWLALRDGRAHRTSRLPPARTWLCVRRRPRRRPTSAAATTSPSSASRFLDMVPSWSTVISWPYSE